jgi:hypothetical protein
VTKGKRGGSDQFDAQMDGSLSVAFEAYAKAVDAARVASDRMLAEGRAEDVNALFGLIIASWKLTEMHDDVLSLTRQKAQHDETRAAQKLLDELAPEFVDGRTIVASTSAIPRRDFELVLKATYDETKELQRRANKQLVAEAVLHARMQFLSELDREGWYPQWMYEHVEKYVAGCTRKPSATTALDKLKTQAKEPGYNTDNFPSRQAIQKWIEKILQRNGHSRTRTRPVRSLPAHRRAGTGRA